MYKPVWFRAYKWFPLYKLTVHIYFLIGISWDGQISLKPYSWKSIFSLTLWYSTNTSSSTCPHLESWTVPPNFYFILCFLSLLSMPLFTEAWNLSYWLFFFIISFLFINLVGSASIISVTSLLLPIIIVLLLLGRTHSILLLLLQ